MYNFLVLIVLICMVSCTQKTDKTTEGAINRYSISETLPVLQQQGETRKVSGAEGGTIYFSEGASITVPANAFVCDGKVVTDSVEINYTQYSNSFDIFASGIPMQFDSAGESYTFKSAGMCKVVGTYNGKQVQVNKDKYLDVSMLSKYESNEYALYYFDTIAGQWKNKGKDRIRKLEKINIKQVEADRKKLMQKRTTNIFSQKGTEDENVIPIVVYDVERFPKLKIFSSIALKVDNKEKYNMKEIVSKEWYDMQLDSLGKGGNFNLKLYGANDETELQGTLLLDGMVYEKAMKEYPRLFKEYQKRIRREDSLAQVRNLFLKAREISAQVEREFIVDGFGIWNCDAPLLVQGRPVKVYLNSSVSDVRFTSVTIAYEDLNAVYPESSRDGKTVIFKLLNSKHIIYAVSTDLQLFIGVVEQSKFFDTDKEISINLRKLENKTLIYKDIKKQAQETVLSSTASGAIGF